MDIGYRVDILPYLLRRLTSAKGFTCYVEFTRTEDPQEVLKAARKTARCAKKGLATIKLYRHFRGHPGGGRSASIQVILETQLKEQALGLLSCTVVHRDYRDNTHHLIELSENFKATWGAIINTIEDIRYPERSCTET